jgi:hypothetical protein
VTLLGLIRYHVLFVIDIGSRTVEIAGIGRDPGGRWMEQMARNLVDAEDGLLRGKRYVIIDRDPLYTAAFRGILKAAGVKAVQLPAMSPNLNAYAERFVLSIKSECLERIVPLGEGHLRHAISEYMAHYYRERNHQGLGNALIDGEQQDVSGAGRIVRRERLGGLLSFYHRKTAVVRQDVVRDVCFPTVAMMDSGVSHHASPSCIVTRWVPCFSASLERCVPRSGECQTNCVTGKSGWAGFIEFTPESGL